MSKRIVAIVIAAAVCLSATVYAAASIIRIKPDFYLDYMPDNSYETGVSFHAENDGKTEGMKCVYKTDAMGLYINEKNTCVAVFDYINDSIWYSNPVDVNEDPIANPEEKALMSSQFSLTYYDTKLNLVTKENFTESISREQFKLESIQNGVRIIYTLGDFSKNVDFLPLYIKPERLEELVLSKLNSSDRNYVKTKYFESEEKSGFLQRGIGVEKSTLVTNKLISLFEGVGYTYEERDEDDKLANYKTQETRSFFTVPLEYRLVDGCLTVSLPVSKIEKPDSFHITAIRLLNFFGAAGEEEGYILVPNGSGSLINFNNGKTTAPAYVQPVYGFDPLVASRTGNEISESVRMPIFGMKKSSHAFLAVIEEGDAFASVTADISKKSNSYNTAGVIFNIKTSEKLSMMGVTGDMSGLPVIDSGDYHGRLSVSYRFLGSDDADYSGMAKAYQQALVDRHDLKPIQGNDDTAFFLDLVGTIEQNDRILGIPHQKPISLTTVEQAMQIVKELQAKKITNIKLRYQGWFNGGINHYSVKSFDISKKNGSLKELCELDKLLEDTGGKLYLDTAFLKIYKNSGSHGYKKRKESSRYISGAEVLLSPYNPATLKMSVTAEARAYYILSPAYLANYMDKFLANFSKSKLSGVSLQDFGDILPSDKDKSQPINREQSKIIIEHELESLYNSVGNTMLTGGNMYAVPYADVIVDAPLYSNKYLIIDEDIPFYQMVLHGYVEYSAKAQNEYSMDSTDDQLLKLVEYGCGLRYLWTYSDDSMLKNSGLKYSSVNYKNSIEQSAGQYQKISDALNGLNGVVMVSHQILKEGLRKTVYQNGTTIYVNYNNEKESADGHDIDAKSFYVSEVRS